MVKIVRMGAMRIASLNPKFNGSHFVLPPSSIHRMTGWVAISRILWRMRTAPLGWYCNVLKLFILAKVYCSTLKWTRPWTGLRWMHAHHTGDKRTIVAHVDQQRSACRKQSRTFAVEDLFWHNAMPRWTLQRTRRTTMAKLGLVQSVESTLFASQLCGCCPGCLVCAVAILGQSSPLLPWFLQASLSNEVNANVRKPCTL